MLSHANDTPNESSPWMTRSVSGDKTAISGAKTVIYRMSTGGISPERRVITAGSRGYWIRSIPRSWCGWGIAGLFGDEYVVECFRFTK